MTRAHVYIDDFNVEVRPRDWAKYGISYGFVAAILPHNGVSLIEARIRQELDVTSGLGLSSRELHGKEIVSGKNGWKTLSVEARVSLIKRVLETARDAGTHYIWELVQDGRPEFMAAREEIAAGLDGALPSSSVRRLSPEGDPRLPIASVLQRSAVAYAVHTFGATEVEVVQDKGIPRDPHMEKRFVDGAKRCGVAVRLLNNADSRLVLGLQLADAAATVLNAGFKLSRQLDDLRESGDFPDLFTRYIIELDVINVLETRIRTHRAVDLGFAEKESMAE